MRGDMGTGGMSDASKRKRVFIWVFELSEDLVDELSLAGVDVVAIGQGKFPGIASFSIHDLFYGTSVTSKFDFEPAPSEWLDDEWFRLYAKCIDRLGFVPFTERTETIVGGITPGYEVEDLARLQLSYATTVLKGLVIDEVWFCCPPHLGVDLMLSLAAQKLGMRVLEFTQVPSVRKFSVRVDGGKGRVRWDDVPRQNWTEGVFPPNLFYMKKPFRHPLRQTVFRGVPSIVGYLAKGEWRSVSEIVYAKSGRSGRGVFMRLLERLDPRLSPWERLRTKMNDRFQKRKSSNDYVTDLSKVRDFIYFPLHYEPEMNLHILGREFCNQIDAIQAIRAILPEGWRLLVKENPQQGYMNRGDSFYRRIETMSNVDFVSDEMPSAELIDKCRLVATIVGTAGYEALLAGKCCIYFGEAWYGGLPGTFGFHEGMDIESIATFKPEKAALDSGMNALLGKLPDGLAYPRYAVIHDGDERCLYRETARSMAAISQAIDR